MEGLRHRLDDEATAAGLDLFGVTSADEFAEVHGNLIARRNSGRAAGLGFTYRDPKTATTPRDSFPWAMSLLVGARTYLPVAGSPGPGAGGRIARVAVDDAYQPLRLALEKLAAGLRREGYLAEVLCDDNRLVDRAAAVRAGLGWWGKNTMVLAPRFGPWLLFGSVVTSAVLEPDQPMGRDCGSCEACLPACPTGALVAPGILDARRCLAAWAQAPGSIPVEFRRAMGDRLYGCDDCIEACPPGHRLLERSAPPRGRVDLKWVLWAADSELLSRFGHWFIPDRDPSIIRRNALIGAGNSGDRSMVPVVAHYVGHQDPNLAEHAIWALATLGGSAAAAALQAVGAPPPRGR
ncbi:MAG TPA: tRNA epoxyqueuosine(34) reductase QueG [Acidimicrobiia bacterium]|nr:tRNA epoxyqueuosine(34) reductase QueG [Acidimicrobiia bacterium]